MRRKFLLLIAVLAITLPSVRGSQVPVLPQELSVRVWTRQQGLPDDSITAVLQTHEGYLWIGTSAGLARFDGVRFVSVVPQSDKTNAPISVTALCEDSSGRLWIGTQNSGLLCRSNGTVNRFQGKETALGNTINSIAEDGAGNLWLGTPSGLIRLNAGVQTRFTSKDGLPNDFVSNVSVARSGTVWITTRAGICRFRDGKVSAYPFQTDSPGRSPESLGVYEDRRGNIWAFGDTYLVNLNEGQHLNHFGSGDMTSSTRIWSLCEGRRGELWIGTSGKGLYCFTDNQFIPVALKSGGLTSDVRALCEDREGNLWLGTYGGGLVRLQGRNMRILDGNAGFPDQPVSSIAFAVGKVWVGFERGGVFSNNGETYERIAGESFQNLVSCMTTAGADLWIGTPGDGLFRISGESTEHFTTANGLADNRILSIAAASNGTVWVGSAAGTLHRFGSGSQKSFGLENGLPAQPITAIQPDAAGNLWIGFANGEVVFESNEIFRVSIEPGQLHGKAVQSLHMDAQKRLWVGTSNGELGCLAGHQFFSWDLNPGLVEHAIAGILSDDEGDLWLSAGNAIYHVGMKEIAPALTGQSSIRPQLLFKPDSVSATTPMYGWPRALKTDDGRLWFALANQVIVFDLRTPTSEISVPPMLIEEVAVNGRPIEIRPATAGGVRFPSDMRSLAIQFTALNLSQPEKIRFRHRLEGYESDWVSSSEQARNASYGKLPYGSYIFHVQAGYDGGTWFDNEASFSFILPIPFWRTGWAIAAYAIAALVFVAIVVRMVSNRRLRHRLAALAAQQAMERERMRIAQDMHDEIGSKLTKISFMSEHAKRELDGQRPVAEKLDSIASTSRDLLQSLDEIVWAVNPHNDTLEHLAAYLGQYATEYLQNTAVQCDLKIARGLPDHPLSAEARHNLFLAFEEALNNALKHGRASHIQVEMFMDGSRFRIRVTDNGSGFDMSGVKETSVRRGNGLRNMRERLAAVGGQFEIQSKPGHGAVVSFSVPLSSKKLKA